MKKIEAPTLAEAYELAALELECSITELHYEVIQHPSGGILGLFKKNAIIFAECKRESDTKPDTKKAADEIIETIKAEENKKEEQPKDDPVPEVKPEPKKEAPKASGQNSFNDTSNLTSRKIEKEDVKKRENSNFDTDTAAENDAVLDSFFEGKDTAVQQRPANNNLELAEKIEAELSELISHSCFDIDTVEVDVVDNTALIFIDGEDAALLIGKEGYRYNALSYMLFNWLHNRYDLYIKLEIAQFLTTQQEMIQNYIQPVIEFVHSNGRGKTRPLDGILVQIALEQLREEFPNKYVAVKTGRDGRKFIVINEFNTKKI